MLGRVRACKSKCGQPYTQVHVYMYVQVHVYMYVQVHVYMYVHVHVHMYKTNVLTVLCCVCVHVCVYVYSHSAPLWGGVCVWSQ